VTAKGLLCVLFFGATKAILVLREAAQMGPGGRSTSTPRASLESTTWSSRVATHGNDYIADATTVISVYRIGTGQSEFERGVGTDQMLNV
jgi:hypothetical protein